MQSLRRPSPEREQLAHLVYRPLRRAPRIVARRRKTTRVYPGGAGAREREEGELHGGGLGAVAINVCVCAEQQVEGGEREGDCIEETTSLLRRYDDGDDGSPIFG